MKVFWLLGITMVFASAVCAVDAGGPAMELSRKFPRISAPGGRKAVQLSSGPGICYPLYYFTPSVTRDREHLVYHRYENKDVQLWLLNLATAENVQLTHATESDTDWRPWQREPGLHGVMDYRSTLVVARNVVVYFRKNTAHAIDLDSLKDETLFTLPGDREAIGQNCATPDGKDFIFISAPAGSENPKPCKGRSSSRTISRRRNRRCSPPSITPFITPCATTRGISSSIIRPATTA